MNTDHDRMIKAALFNFICTSDRKP